MAQTNQQLEARLNTVEANLVTLDQTLTDLMNGTKKFADFTDAEALYTLSNIYKGQIQVDINSSINKTNLYCMGIKAGINDGNFFSGWRSTVPNPTTDTDFDIKGYST